MEDPKERPEKRGKSELSEPMFPESYLRRLEAKVKTLEEVRKMLEALKQVFDP